MDSSEEYCLTNCCRDERVKKKKNSVYLYLAIDNEIIITNS